MSYKIVKKPIVGKFCYAHWTRMGNGKFKWKISWKTGYNPTKQKKHIKYVDESKVVQVMQEKDAMYERLFM